MLADVTVSVVLSSWSCAPIFLPLILEPKGSSTVSPSFLISTPPRSIVLPLKNSSLNLFVALPKSMVSVELGIM